MYALYCLLACEKLVEKVACFAQVLVIPLKFPLEPLSFPKLFPIVFHRNAGLFHKLYSLNRT